MEQRARSEKTASLAERVKAFYERVSTDRERALEQLPELFSSDVQFVNPVADKHGLDEFREAWVKAFSMYKVFTFSELKPNGGDDHFTMTYVMKNGFGIGPVFKGTYISEYKARDGKVYWMRDYFDTVGTLLAPVPPLLALYKWVFRFLIA